jgi:preprotein translocase subunit SecE
VARNRKRAKERRSRRPAPAQVSRPGFATAGADRDEELELPAALEHSAPDVELAEAQLAVGRPDLASDDDGGAAEPEDDGLETFDDDFDEDGSDDAGGGLGGGGGRELTAAGAPVPEHAHRPWLGLRVFMFLQASWRELQRVQWPDRRQVVQATGVVIGFVIVAGVYLGVADTLATRLMNFILK